MLSSILCILYTKTRGQHVFVGIMQRQEGFSFERRTTIQLARQDSRNQACALALDYVVAVPARTHARTHAHNKDGEGPRQRATLPCTVPRGARCAVQCWRGRACLTRWQGSARARDSRDIADGRAPAVVDGEGVHHLRMAGCGVAGLEVAVTTCRGQPSIWRPPGVPTSENTPRPIAWSPRTMHRAPRTASAWRGRGLGCGQPAPGGCTGCARR